ncbi:MAG: cellulase family glycosylhydrolase [Verrucomicrobiota bacterium]
MTIPRLLLLSLLALSPFVAQASARPSILPDGTFETIDPRTGRPADWPEARGVSWPQEDGNRFLRLDSTAPGRMDSLILSVPLSDDVRALELGYRARVTGLKRGEKPWYDARIILNFKDASGKRIGNAPPAYHRDNTKGWENRSTRFLVPAGVATLEFMPSLFQVERGTFDLDDITLTPIDHVELAAEIAKNTAPPPPPREQARRAAWPAEIKVVGNRLHDTSGREVWLQGVNVPSLEWSPKGDNVLRSTLVVIDDWKATGIRLPVKDIYWFGKSPEQEDGGKAYRELVDAIIILAANRGVYVVLDLHHYRAPKEEHIAFWTDAATRYRNHPAVLFDLLNEPHGISWDVWRDGGFVSERKAGADEDNFLSDEEKVKAKLGFRSPGMQRMVEVVRATGARNVIVAGGLDYAYDLSGILKGYALTDTAEGNGIMYASHIYPWKRDWQGKMLDIAAHHPILIGEVGADNRKQPWEKAENFVQPETWVPDMLGLIQKHRLNWTGWSFHPKAGPRMLLDWRYTPTPYWGEPAKRALAGEQFELKRLR